MSRRRQTGGIDRILEKLERNVQNGSYYEAFQMYNSIYNRSGNFYYFGLSAINVTNKGK